MQIRIAGMFFVLIIITAFAAHADDAKDNSALRQVIQRGAQQSTNLSQKQQDDISKELDSTKSETENKPSMGETSAIKKSLEDQQNQRNQSGIGQTTTDNSSKNKKFDDPIYDKSNKNNKTGSNSDNKVDSNKNNKDDSNKKSDAKDPQMIADLQKNVQNMKDKENSLGNKLVSGASIGAMGYGGSQFFQGMEEKGSDEHYDQEMRSYMASLNCFYDKGQTIPYGGKGTTPGYSQKSVALRGELDALNTQTKQYVTALGLAPGIESEAIVDKSSLYDGGNHNLPSIGGTYTTAAQRLASGDAKKKMTTGLVVAGVGAAIGVVGNALVNKNAAKEDSQNIIQKYATEAAEKAKEAKIDITGSGTGTGATIEEIKNLASATTTAKSIYTVECITSITSSDECTTLYTIIGKAQTKVTELNQSFQTSGAPALDKTEITNLLGSFLKQP